MARPKKEVKAEVIGSTFEDKKDIETSSKMVTLCVGLRSGMRFDDLPDGKGGVKSIRLAGIDDHLRGQRQGILTPDGNATFQQIPAEDWANLKRMYGSMQMFHSFQNRPPLIQEVDAVSAKKGAYNDEIKQMVTGTAPKDPKDLKVTEDKEA